MMKLKNIYFINIFILFTVIFGTCFFKPIEVQGGYIGLIKGSFINLSDTQYPWTDKTDNGEHEDENTQKIRSEELIREQFNSVNNYSDHMGSKDIPVIINGDITAYGHNWQWDKMLSLLGILKLPYLFGLGNHDIENNLNDTYLNRAIIR